MKKEKGIKIARYLCLFPGVFLIVSGLLLLLFPVAAGELFDIDNIEILRQPMALAMGVRQFAIGLMITALVFTNQLRALAYIMLIGAIVPLTDFFLFSQSTGVVSALRHAAPVPVILGLGSYLLYSLKRSNN